MQKVNRKFVPKPEILSGTEVRRFEAELLEHFRLEPGERLRQRAPYPSKILSHVEIGRSLSEVFSGKCAYCEALLSDRGIGQVSHYRPQSSARSGPRKDSPDHYAWFACEWNNLLLLCEQCNRSKSNLFPVSDEHRALPMSTWAEANRLESPLLLDPCKDDPRKHFRFARSGRLFPISERGAVTADILNLRRDELTIARGQRFEWVLALIANPSTERKRFASELTPMLMHYGAVSIFLQQLCAFAIDYKPLRYILARADLATVAEHLHELEPGRLEEALKESEAIRDLEPDIVKFQPEEAIEVKQRREQPRLSGVRIKNFKGIAELVLPFDYVSSFEGKSPDSAMLLGENSTGKSSVLQAIALALMTPAEKRTLRLEPQDFVSRDPGTWLLDTSQEMVVELNFLNHPSCRLTYLPVQNKFDLDSKVPCTLLAYGSRRFFLTQGDGVANKTLFDPMATLPDPVSWLQKLDEHDFNAVARAMRSILALKHDDRIFRDPEGGVLVKAHGRVSPIERMSDGYRSLFAMATDIMRRMLVDWENLEYARGIVLIDEIETHLHPRWKLRVMTALREAMPQVQFVVTTHDPLCLRGMRNGEVKVLFREADGRVVLLEDLPNIESLRAEQILVSDYFGLHSTADPEQEKILEELATLGAESEDNLSQAKRKQRDELLEKYGGIPFIGNSRDRQILTEAITRHLREHSARTIELEAGMREDSISAIIAVLKRSMQT